MLFAVYNQETGEIDQAIKHYDPEGYDKLLDEAGHKYIAVQTSEGLPRPGTLYVDLTSKELVERPDMPIELDKDVIVAGGDMTALFTGIPVSAKVTIAAVGAILHQIDPLDASELEIAIPVPCTYTITIQKWPYKDYVRNVEAVHG